MLRQVVQRAAPGLSGPSDMWPIMVRCVLRGPGASFLGQVEKASRLPALELRYRCTL